MISRRVFLALPLADRLAGQDWPQWRGPNRDGSLPPSGAPQSWPEKLKPVWKVRVGEGHSSPVVSGNRVFQFARVGGDEVVYAFDVASGKKLFEYMYAAPYEMNPAATAHGKGPKSTPTAARGRLYTFGISGVLTCLDTNSGTAVWRYDSAGKFPQTSPHFGVAMSPLVHDGRVIAHVGTDDNGALTAFHAATGRIEWQWRGQGPGYGSPVLAGPAAAPQIITFSSEKLIGVAAANGKLLWEIPFTTPYAQNAVTPLVINDLVIYSGLAAPVTAIRIGTGVPQKVWENKQIGMYMSSPVLAAGLVHGLSHRNKGQYFSVQPQTGKTVWTSEGRQGENAMLVASGSHVFALNTDSELHIMRATPRGLEPLRKYTVADSPTWAHPVILGNRVLVKDRDSLALWTA
jgi:outer membrane protein assembly factor BamB